MAEPTQDITSSNTIAGVNEFLNFTLDPERYEIEICSTSEMHGYYDTPTMRANAPDFFRAIIYKKIWDGENVEFATRHALLRLDLSLPFPPFAGLKISGDMTDIGQITKVSWHINGMNMGSFICEVENELSHQSINICDYNFNQLVENSMKRGWKLVEKQD